MITLQEIWIYPVKSLPGVRARDAQVDERGLVGDRRFMIVDATGRFLTQRERPELALLRAELASDQLRVHTPDGRSVEIAAPRGGDLREVRVWDQTVAASDAGDAAASFLASYLDADVRLVHMPESTRRPADPKHARETDVIGFQDGFPFLLIGRESLAALNNRLERPVDMRRFRPNLVVEGAAAFHEDTWASFEIGDVAFHAKKACSRCQMVDVDPDLGERSRGVLSELSSFRTIERAARFGQNLVHDGAGALREGAPVIVSRTTAG